MPRFEPKIEPFGLHVSPAEGRDAANGWCRRNVEQNLRAFKAEFLRQWEDGFGSNAERIMEVMLPDPPAEPVNDDAKDAARFRWLADMRQKGIALYLIGDRDFRYAVDEAMEREAKG